MGGSEYQTAENQASDPSAYSHAYPIPVHPHSSISCSVKDWLIPQPIENTLYNTKRA